jgi:hypothetical protein
MCKDARETEHRRTQQTCDQPQGAMPACMSKCNVVAKQGKWPIMEKNARPQGTRREKE